MGATPPDQHPTSEPAASASNDPASGPGSASADPPDFPERSHFTEFDLAIESALASSQATPRPEDAQRTPTPGPPEQSEA